MRITRPVLNMSAAVDKLDSSDSVLESSGAPKSRAGKSCRGSGTEGEEDMKEKREEEEEEEAFLKASIPSTKAS